MRSVAKMSLRLSILASILMMLALGSLLAESRYLPTRSDGTEVEILKSLIQNILDEAREHELERQQQQQQQRLTRSARFFSTRNNRARPSLAQPNSYAVDETNEANGSLDGSYGYQQFDPASPVLEATGSAQRQAGERLLGAGNDQRPARANTKT